MGLSWPRPPRQPWQDERHQDGGEQVDGVVVQNGFSADSAGGGRLVAHHLSDARVKACKSSTRSGRRDLGNGDTSRGVTRVLQVRSEEGVQHGAQQAGRASVQDEGPLRVGGVQVADQQQLRHKVSCPHHQPPQEAGDQANQGDAAVRTFWRRNI